MKIFAVFCSALVFATNFLLLSSAHAEMVYVYSGLESAADTRNDFRWNILRTALERTKDGYGAYVLRAGVPMSVKRQISELEANSGSITVAILDTLLASKRHLFPISVPLDKGLNGYRVFLIRRSDQDKFAAVQSMADLQKFRFGQEDDWEDVDILRANAFTVVTGVNYAGLFRMLTSSRFDAFPRGATEILDEFDARKDGLPELAIEKGLMLYYPWPIFFWFANTPQGMALAKRAEEGMWGMIKDGTYDSMFWQYYGEAIDRLDLAHRRIFVLPNPYLTLVTPPSDSRLWLTPVDIRRQFDKGQTNRTAH
jgi:hypothetical protein